jgi:hypothetical protein
MIKLSRASDLHAEVMDDYMYDGFSFEAAEVKADYAVIKQFGKRVLTALRKPNTRPLSRMARRSRVCRRKFEFFF